VRGDPLGISPGVHQEKIELEDKERRETGREFQVIHPHAPFEGVSPARTKERRGSAVTGIGVSAPNEDVDNVHAFQE
jgi:hypothetical protein